MADNKLTISHGGGGVSLNLSGNIIADIVEYTVNYTKDELVEITMKALVNPKDLELEI